MNATFTMCFNNVAAERIFQWETVSLFFTKQERNILKIFLIVHLHQIFFDLFINQFEKNNDSTEYYSMDNKIIQLLIQAIVETGEYTLEGIANCTRIPFDVIYDAACGINNQLSVASWIRITELYMQLKPNVGYMLIDKLLAIKNQSTANSILHKET